MAASAPARGSRTLLGRYRSRSLRHRYSAEEKAAIRETLHIDGDERWRFRFGALLSLSVVIAVMGLSANSSAVVIGAMLVAPLMSPVLALAYAIATGWPRRIFLAFSTVVAASVGCVALSALLAWLLPETPLSSEILARTKPDIRDLLVALAAGAAGAYATLREGNSSLPGVAVAVALVPPLGTVGITLESQDWDLAGGAMLLYATNLAAIVLSGILVMIGSGFVTWRRVTQVGHRVGLGIGITAATVIGVGVPLVDTSLDTLDQLSAARAEAATIAAVEQIVADWLPEEGGIRLRSTDVNLDNKFVVVTLSGEGNPPDDTELAGLLLPVVGEEVEVAINELGLRRPTDAVLGEADQDLTDDLSDLVVEWVRERAATSAGSSFEVTDVKLETSELVVLVAGTETPPPPDEELLDAIAALDDRPLVIAPDPSAIAAVEETPGPEQLAAEVVREWLEPTEGFVVDRVEVGEGDPIPITLDLSGPSRPDDLAALSSDLSDALGGAVALDASLALRVPLEAERANDR